MKGRTRLFKTKRYPNSFLSVVDVGKVSPPMELFVVSLTPEKSLLFSIPIELALSTGC